MRITKRSSGGRGEYEISESHGSVTARHLLNRIIVLDLGCQIELTTGVRLLLKNGKLRLRIDESAGGEIHLHRQLAAAVLLPHPARDESIWASDSPVIRSGLYGIGNIELSSVALAGNDIARVGVGSLVMANRGGEDYVNCAERMTDVLRLWERVGDLPSPFAALISEHRRLVEAGGPLGLDAENVISALQDAVSLHFQAQALVPFPASDEDPLPFLLRMLRSDAAVEIGSAVEKTQISHHARIRIAALMGQSFAENESGLQEPRVSQNAEIEIAVSHQEEQFAIPEAAAGSTGQDQESQVEDHAAELHVRRPLSPRKYRPQPRGVIVSARSAVRPTSAEEQRDVSVPIDLRLRRRHGGTYMITFLPRRRSGMPAVLDVNYADQPIQLSALHENWYQDVVLLETEKHLREGLVWFAEGSSGNFRWGLAGREVFVLGTRDELSGFISVPRLVLGAEHFVLCREEIRQEVLNVLAECCDSIPVAIGESEGLPNGWVGIGPITPTLPLPPSDVADTLDVLRPDPAISIAFESGIRLQHNQFLLNYPPVIRVHGDIPPYVRIMIDGEPAVRSDNGFTSSRWDSPGEHVVSCGVISRSYTVVEPDDEWETWPAYSFALNAQFRSELISICGAHVTAREPGRALVLVPVSTPFLLGSKPGEVYLASVRQNLRVPICAAVPPFIPVWAVPRNPLRADKASARVLLLNERAHPLKSEPIPRFPPSRAVLHWCVAILDSCRKGLSVDPAEDRARALWRSYRDFARRLRRAFR